MFSYYGKIAGVVKCGAGIRYVIATPRGEKLEIERCGDIIATAAEEPWDLLAGCKCIYGLGTGEYVRRRLNLIDEAVVADPDQFLWELSRSCSESMDNYLYALLQTHRGENTFEVTCLTVNRRLFEDIGHSFDRRGLTLDRMVFLPEAYRQALKPYLQAERDLLLIENECSIHLQLFHRGRLAAFETIEHGDTDRRHEQICEEIGIVMMSIFGGRTLRRQVQAHLIGSARLEAIATMLQQQLPYDFTFLHDELSRLQLTLPPAITDLRQYFSALAPAYAYYLKEVCASLPAKSAAST